jgi:hypothetical protein
MKIMRRLSVFCDGAGRLDAENTHLTGRGRASPETLHPKFNRKGNDHVDEARLHRNAFWF